MPRVGRILKILFVRITDAVIGGAILLLGGFVAYRALTQLWEEIRNDAGREAVAYVKCLFQEPQRYVETPQNAPAAGSDSGTPERVR